MNAPIGLLDSGVGGISVLQALEQVLPHQNYIYFADAAHFPYGEKTAAEILRFSSQITAFLLTQNIQMLVIACHTASAFALKSLPTNFPIPIIGMIEATMKTLQQTTKNGRIAILGTKATIQSQIYQNAILKIFPHAVLFPLASLELETAIQNGNTDLQALIQDTVKPLLDQEVDTLILACTHYPHIKLEIEEELDPETTVLNPSLAVAEEVKRLLKSIAPSNHAPHHVLYTSGEEKALKEFLEKHLLNASYEIRKHMH